MLISRYDFEVFADYHQFYIEDEDSPHETHLVWDPEQVAFGRMLGTGTGLVAVLTARSVEVPVSVEIHDGEPNLDLESPSRVVECSLDVRTGKLVVAGCTEYLPDAPRIGIPPGIYRVRVSYAGLETVEDEFEGDDSYLVQFGRNPR